MFQKRHLGRTKILEHKHTGKLQPHHHTSYGGLLLVLVLACCCVLLTEHTVSADDTGAVQTFAVVPAPLYRNGPTISNLQNGQQFRTTDPAVVSGSCPGRSLVEIFKNDVMAGAVLCNGGSYQLSVGLFNGSNTLVARAYNANGIPSPDSVPVTVRLTAVGNLFGNGGLPFYVSADQKYEAAKTGDQLSWLLTLSGGQAPYAVSVNWGDGKSDLFSRTSAGSYNLSHAYQYAASAGNYTVVVKATDQAGTSSYVQLVAIVRGAVAAPVITQTTAKNSGAVGMILKITVVVLASVGLAIAGFWVGEQRELRLLNRQLGRVS